MSNDVPNRIDTTKEDFKYPDNPKKPGFVDLKAIDPFEPILQTELDKVTIESVEEKYRGYVKFEKIPEHPRVLIVRINEFPYLDDDMDFKTEKGKELLADFFARYSLAVSNEGRKLGGSIANIVIFDEKIKIGDLAKTAELSKRKTPGGDYAYDDFLPGKVNGGKNYAIGKFYVVGEVWIRIATELRIMSDGLSNLFTRGSTKRMNTGSLHDLEKIKKNALEYVTKTDKYITKGKDVVEG